MQWLADVYRDHRRQLFLIAWGILRRSDLAEDAVHAAFVRLVELPQVPREPKPYVCKAVRNAALNLAASQARRREQPIDTADDPAALPPGGPDEQAVEGVRLALEQLDADSREVIELHLQGGFTFQEIADLCGEPLATVASRYRRGLAKIRERLEVRNG